MPAYKRAREFKLLLPPDISERIAREALEEGRPQGRIIINHLGRIPYLDRMATLGELIGQMENTLARYGSRFVQTELSESMLAAVDEILTAQTPAQLEAPIDKLRIFRGAMLKGERDGPKMEREELAARIALLERQLVEIEALPDSAIAKDEIPGRRRVIEDLKRAAAASGHSEKAR